LLIRNNITTGLYKNALKNTIEIKHCFENILLYFKFFSKRKFKDIFCAISIFDADT
jgi:hypothetical protein